MNVKIEPRTDTKRKDGLKQFRIKVGTGDVRKFIPLDIYADVTYWDSEQEVLVVENKAKNADTKKRNEQHKQYNILISAIRKKCNDIISDFERQDIYPTPTQFVERYNSKIGVQAKIAPYFEQRVKTLRDTGHIGNALCYERTLAMLRLFDKRFDKLYFDDITLAYVNKFDAWMQKSRTSTYSKGNRIVQRDGCSGNTRKYYHKALRALLNLAIKEKLTDGKAYPYGKGGFEVGSLEETTDKRYLPISVMQTIKATELNNPTLEVARRLFVAQYLCYGISFMDAGLLTQKHIVTLNKGRFIVYRRQKTKNAKKVTPITVPITPELQGHLDWFAEHCLLVGDHIFPIVSIHGYSGEKLYNHIRSRFVRNNRLLKEIAKEFGVTDMALTSYVSRHTMAMTLQENNVSREKISQALGHQDLSTTATYLDSFNAEALAELTKEIL